MDGTLRCNTPFFLAVAAAPVAAGAPAAPLSPPPTPEPPDDATSARPRHFGAPILWAYVTARPVDVIVNPAPETTRFRQSIVVKREKLDDEAPPRKKPKTDEGPIDLDLED